MTEPAQPQTSKREDTRKTGTNQWQHRIRSFTKRHYKWIVLAGSLMVSVTLTARDTYHEKEKSFVEAVENVQNFYRLRELTEFISDRVGRLDNRISALQNNRRTAGGEAISTQDSERENATDPQVRQIIIQLNYIEDLLHLVPDDGSHWRVNFAALVSESDRWRLQKNAAVADLSKTMAPHGGALLRITEQGNDLWPVNRHDTFHTSGS
jgi:hypothetical protein